ncbi:MAG: class IV adenylate cyclase [Candidatus Sungbacteria bacterium]|nr:class IV adenylate cyclase [Candidatus Sungbacteria bacterium]
MKREIELKFITHDFTPIRRRLRKLGAKLKWSGKEKNRYLDTREKDLLKKGIVLRLRIAGDHRLTLKANSTHHIFKSADEYEISISDAEETQKLLAHLGFQKWLAYSKTRECWKLRGADITLDSLPFGKFVEIEASPDKIRALAEKLGLSFVKSTTKSYIELLREHSK